MQVPPDHNRHMAMLKAALPYAMPESRRAIEIMLQADALIHTARGQSDERYSLEAAGLSLEDQPSAPDFTPNPETMLQCIREYCTPKEADFVQTVLNVLQANQACFEAIGNFKNHIPQLILQPPAAIHPTVN